MSHLSLEVNTTGTGSVRVSDTYIFLLFVVIYNYHIKNNNNKLW